MEVGYVAIGVGALAGIGASKMAGGKSAALGVIAAIFSILGVFGGKYMYVAHDVSSFEKYVMESREMTTVPEEHQALALALARVEFEKLYGAKPEEIGFLSVGPVTKIMFAPETEIFGGLGILFAIFALVAAWKFANKDSVVTESCRRIFALRKPVIRPRVGGVGVAAHFPETEDVAI